ncbi:hypothetical protein [Phormidium sp. CCY1219]|uniref:hypothetical protein n=1 Tax=Phormidium sp. CCY1219 TaxID=2886104 RepID=UPI002D768025|nr:hypothetical protein [Phormidium sp. CCY1219]
MAWALHLMQQAFDQSEFSLMLAGTLVAMAAAAMMAVYFLMGDYMLYVKEMAQRGLGESSYDSVSAVSVSPWIEAWPVEYSETTDGGYMDAYMDGYMDGDRRSPLLP